MGMLLDICPDAIVYHEGGGSIGKKTRAAYFNYVSGSLGVFLSHGPVILWPVFILRHLLKLTALIIFFRISLDSIVGYLKGIVDSLSRHAIKK